MDDEDYDNFIDDQLKDNKGKDALKEEDKKIESNQSLLNNIGFGEKKTSNEYIKV